MNKNIFLVIIAVLIIVGVTVYFKSDKSNKSEMADAGALMESNTATSTGSYEAYSASKLALADTGKVVLFFRASWCPTCRAVDADIKAHLNSIPEGVHILDVNYDNSTDLKKKYGVTYQHTFVQVSSDGGLIEKWSGSPTLADLVNQIK